MNNKELKHFDEFEILLLSLGFTHSDPTDENCIEFNSPLFGCDINMWEVFISKDNFTGKDLLEWIYDQGKYDGKEQIREELDQEYKDQIEYLRKRNDLLRCLEEAGVDNWSGVGYARQEFNKLYPNT